MSTVMDKPKGDSRSRRKKKVALVTAALLTVSGGAAIAYWTVGGTGTGEAMTGTSENITVVQTGQLTPMHPGDEEQTLSGTFNNGNNSPVYVKTVTASIEPISVFGTVGQYKCNADDYTLTNATMTVNKEVPAGLGQEAWSGAKIKFNNKDDVNQDTCKNLKVKLKYTIG